MDIKIKTSILLIPLSMALLSGLRIWQFMSGRIGTPVMPPVHDRDVYTCDHDYNIELLSVDPLIMYINNFLKETEVQHLLDFSQAKFGASMVYNENLETVVDTRYRTSQSAMVPRNDTISQCLSQRLTRLLGNVQHIDTEPIQVVKYEPGEQFRVHMDWFHKPRNRTYNPDMPGRPFNRLASIFAYLSDNCTGGETYFPRVQGVSATADGDKFSRTETGQGLLVRPKRGNAVFWNNLLPNGDGDERVAHAGLPVETGSKIGINLFSHFYLDAPMTGGEEE